MDGGLQLGSAAASRPAVVPDGDRRFVGMASAGASREWTRRSARRRRPRAWDTTTRRRSTTATFDRELRGMTAPTYGDGRCEQDASSLIALTRSRGDQRLASGRLSPRRAVPTPARARSKSDNETRRTTTSATSADLGFPASIRSRRARATSARVPIDDGNGGARRDRRRASPAARWIRPRSG